MQVKTRPAICGLLWAVILSPVTQAETLTTQQLQTFSQEVISSSHQLLEKFRPLLSEEVVMENRIGSNVRGVTLFYGKDKIIEALSKSNKTLAAFNTSEEIAYDIYDHKLANKRTGQFTVISFIEQLNIKMWSIYYVTEQSGHLKVTRIINYL